MSNDTVIRVENLGKRYRLGLTHANSIRDLVGHWTDRIRGVRRASPRVPANGPAAVSQVRTDVDGDPQELWALKDVSFEVKRGEVLGVIGRNGSGKSTLLKILSRVTKPTTGRATIRGRVGSLLEVGTGFHPELTGRENVYLNGSLLGMTRREIQKRFDEIVDFSGVERFIDTPVKRYSSGMKVRLGFAVAAHLEPEILIVDEVLAVGDAEFQKKCLGQMQDISQTGRTILFVSHNMAAVQHLCSRALVLENGSALHDTTPAHATSSYFASCSSASRFSARSLPTVPSGTTVRSVRLCNSELEHVVGVPMGDDLILQLKLHSLLARNTVIVGIGIFDGHGSRICGLNSSDTARFTVTLAEQCECTLNCRIYGVNLMPGGYWVNVMLSDHFGELYRQESALHFTVLDTDVYGTGRIPRGPAIVFLRADWNTH